MAIFWVLLILGQPEAAGANTGTNPGAIPGALMLQVSDSAQRIDASVVTWIDPNGTATLADVLARPAADFQPLPPRGQAPKGRNQAMWLRFELQTAQDHPLWFVSARQVSIDRITFFSQSSKGEWDAQVAGTMVPVAQWAWPETRPVFGVRLKPHTPHRFYVRAHDPYGSWTSLEAMSGRAYLARQSNERLIFGLYIGVTLVVGALGIASWLTWREPVWLGYAAYNSLMALGQISLIGLAGLLLFDQNPTAHELSIFTVVVLSSVACLGFILHTTQASKHAKPLAPVAQAVSGLTLLTVVALWIARGVYDAPGANVSDAFVTTLGNLASALPIIGAFNAILLVALMVVTWRRGHRFSATLLLAMSPVVLGAIPQILYSLNFIERSWLTEYGFVIGLVLEAMMMLYVLQRQSRDLAMTHTRVRDFDRFDALTGLTPRVGATQQLDDIIGHCISRGQRSALMLIQIDDLDILVKEHGPEIQDTILLVSAQQATAQVSAGDLAARVAASSFLVAYGASTHEEVLRQSAAAVVASGLRGHPLLPPQVLLKYRIWITMHDGLQGDAAQAIEHLERHARESSDRSGTKRIIRV